VTDRQPDLQRVFQEATEHVASPELVPRALADAGRRRTRRTAVGALAVVLLLGGGGAWAVQDRSPRADVVDTPDTPTPSPTPTATPSVVDTNPATQPIWDPFTIVDAPRVASRLPEKVVPPVDPPSLAEQPLPAVVLAWPEQHADLRILGTNGEWRSVPGTATAIRGTFHDVVVPVISPAGDRMAMSTDAGILLVDVTTGEQQVLPWPPELVGPFDGRPRLLWLPDDRGFLVLHWEEPWLMDLEGGAGPAPYGDEDNAGLMVDPDTGTVRERRWQDGTVRTWQDDEVASSIRLGGYGERFVTRFAKLAYVGNPGPPTTGVLKSGPVVVDLADGEMSAYAPIRDPNGVYSDNANLTPLGFLDETTVLLLVSPMDYRTMDPDEGRTHLATWDHVTGDFGLLASGGPGMRTITVAPDMVLE
jgi:hypothetical protein